MSTWAGTPDKRLQQKARPGRVFTWQGSAIGCASADARTRWVAEFSIDESSGGKSSRTIPFPVRLALSRISLSDTGTRASQLSPRSGPFIAWPEAIRERIRYELSAYISLRSISTIGTMSSSIARSRSARIARSSASRPA